MLNAPFNLRGWGLPGAAPLHLRVQVATPHVPAPQKPPEEVFYFHKQ
ncbi:hypothetical protein HGH92_22995 [Chitinophaga varians]|uniref:Uncharacterized protein n=1 Tax=Chitinophaga varians TaxID=2202339 RepID=A0A847RVV2_9BACT|nr:hypothetical protein [Chitinophaga varians]NLR67193.1 hypothetical protein [Chitinophaga varians]